VIDGDGVAIYVADITYRSEVIRLHIDLLARSSPAARKVRGKVITTAQR
jgi:hypothetical protein